MVCKGGFSRYAGVAQSNHSFHNSWESYKHFEFSKSNLNFWLGLDAIFMQRVAEWFDNAARPDLQNSDGKVSIGTKT